MKTGWVLGAMVSLSLWAGCDSGNGSKLVDRNSGGSTIASVGGVLSQAAQTNLGANTELAVLWARSQISIPVTEGAPDGGFTPPFHDDFAAATCQDPADAWDQRLPVGDRFEAQKVNFTAHFPSDFTLHLNQLPPAQLPLTELAPDAGAGTIALGVVVAFEDANADGALQKGTPGNDPEKLIASSLLTDSATVIVFLDGAAPSSHRWLPANLPQGYSLVTVKNGASSVVPLASGIVLDANRNRDAYGTLACAELGVRGSKNGPIPADAKVSCAGDKQTLRWDRLAVSQCIQDYSYGTQCIPAGTPPASWPCK